IKLKWASAGKVDCQALEHGFYLFKFDTVGRDWVIENDPWDIWGIHLVLRKWDSSFDMSRGYLWIYGGKGIGCVASSLGEPLYLGTATEATMRLAYARLCVEMPMFGPFPKSIKVYRPYGKIVEFVVEYTWKTNVCQACRSIEHSRANCPIRRETS
ncbi:LOW QUALITY PROTEIN: DUF4283 domain-containing protein, partial [Cephalotus follicularis]